MIYRGSIIEVRENMLIVMLEDSSFKKVKKFNGLEAGMEIYFEERDIIKERNLSFRSISIVAAAIFLFIATSFYGINMWDTNYKAVALVSIDINPSIELKVNKMNHIIKAVALNEDAKNLPLLELKNKPLDKGLEDLIGMARSEGYIKETKENYILIASVKLKDGVEDTKMEELIAESMKQIENSSKDTGEKIEIISISSNKETLKEAHKEKISLGKKEVVQNMGSKNDWKKKSDLDKEKYNQLLKEYTKKTKELENKHKEHDKENKEQIKKETNIIKESMKKEKDELKVIEELKKETKKLREKVLKEETKRMKELKKEGEKAKEETLKEEMNRKKELEKEQERQKRESEREFKKNEKDIEKKLKEETKKNIKLQKEEDKNSDRENKDHEKENKQKERNKKDLNIDKQVQKLNYL